MRQITQDQLDAAFADIHGLPIKIQQAREALHRLEVRYEDAQRIVKLAQDQANDSRGNYG